MLYVCICVAFQCCVYEVHTGMCVVAVPPSLAAGMGAPGAAHRAVHRCSRACITVVLPMAPQALRFQDSQRRLGGFGTAGTCWVPAACIEHRQYGVAMLQCPAIQVLPALHQRAVFLLHHWWCKTRDTPTCHIIVRISCRQAAMRSVCYTCATCACWCLHQPTLVVSETLRGSSRLP